MGLAGWDIEMGRDGSYGGILVDGGDMGVGIVNGVLGYGESSFQE